jgi:serine/threonine-protein kinase
MTMDSARWTQIQSLFHDAADLPKSEQRSFLASACGNDDILLADILALLEEDARSSSLLDHDVAQVAHQVLNDKSPQPASFQEFGHYKIKHVLGEGGMGVVYLAERNDLGSHVAIKL